MKPLKQLESRWRKAAQKAADAHAAGKPSEALYVRARAAFADLEA